MGKDIAATKETADNLEPAGSESQPAARRAWYNIFPVLTWLPAYQPKWLRADLIAGVTLAAYLMPAGLADASLANLPPEAGLYACLYSGLVFWLFCSSQHTAITVTSAISVLVGASLGDLAGGDVSRFWALASCTALIHAGLRFIAWLAKAGVIVNFISESVLVGFKCGIALFIASTQLPKLFGFKGSHGDFWERSGYFFSHLRDTNLASLLLGLGALAVLLLGKRFLKNKPVALFVVIAGIVAASIMDLGSLGVKLLGQVPQGLPPFGLPAVHLSDLNDLLPLALGCFLLGMVETAALGRMFAVKHGYRFDANQELLGIASANVMTGLGYGFPVSGGMSQSLVNESGGARTPLSGFIAALLTLLIVLFVSGALRYLPQPVLAAIVLIAVTGLFKVTALRHLRCATRGPAKRAGTWRAVQRTHCQTYPIPSGRSTLFCTRPASQRRCGCQIGRHQPLQKRRGRGRRFSENCDQITNNQYPGDRKVFNCLVPRRDHRDDSRRWPRHDIEPRVAVYGAAGYARLVNYMAADSHRVLADCHSHV